MGTGDLQLFEEIKSTVLFADDAVSGEVRLRERKNFECNCVLTICFLSFQAAAIAMGLNLLGTANQAAIAEMMTYAHQVCQNNVIFEKILTFSLSLIRLSMRRSFAVLQLELDLSCMAEKKKPTLWSIS